MTAGFEYIGPALETTLARELLRERDYPGRTGPPRTAAPQILKR